MLFRVGFKKDVWLSLSCFRRWLMAAAAAAAAAPAAAPEAAAATSSSSQNWISSKISEGTFQPPRNVLLQLILRHFWREIGWCFAVSSGFRKGCLAFVFLLLAAAAAAAAAAVTSSQQQLLVSSFRGLLIAAAAAAAAATSSTSNSSSRSSSHQQQQSKFDSSRISEGTFRPPRSVLLRLILRHFWHEIRLCFAVSSGFQKGCLAVAFLLSTLVDGSSSRSSSTSSSRSSNHQQQQSKFDF